MKCITAFTVLLMINVNSEEVAFMRAGNPTVSTTLGSSITVTFPVSRLDSSDEWFYKGKMLTDTGGKYEFPQDNQFAKSVNIKEVTLADVGNYTCELGQFVQTKWLYVLQINSFTYKAKVGSPLKLDTCASWNDTISSIDCITTNKDGTVDVKDRITISGDKKSVTISSFIEDYAGTYKCQIQYPYNTIEYNFVVEVDTGSTTERTCSAQGNIHAIEIFGTLEDNEKAVLYHPKMGELNSEVRKSFEEKICQVLHNSRTDVSFVTTFHISCTLIEVHPISSEFVLLLKVQEEHLKYLGFEMNRDGAIKAIQSVYDKPASKEHKVFYFQTLSSGVKKSQEYQTVFVEGAIYLDGKKVEYEPDHDRWDGDEFQRLKENACALIETWRIEDILLHKTPIDCSAYAMDLDSKLVVQLSVYNRDLKKLGIATDETSLAIAIGDWFQRVPDDLKDGQYSPNVITPFITAFWTSATPTITLQSTAFKQYVNWFYSAYAKYHGQAIPLEFTSNSKRNDQVVTSLFSSSKELLKAGMIIRRDYARLLAQPKQEPGSTFVYTITDFKRQTMVKKRVLGTREELMTVLHTKKFESLTPEEEANPAIFCKKVELLLVTRPGLLPHKCELLEFNKKELAVTLRLLAPKQEMTYYNIDDVQIVWTN